MKTAVKTSSAILVVTALTVALTIGGSTSAGPGHGAPGGAHPDVVHERLLGDGAR